MLGLLLGGTVGSLVGCQLGLAVGPTVGCSVGIAEGPFVGQTWVVTGKLEAMSRDAVAEAIRGLGGQTASSVSSKTSVVLAGPGAGSKLSKAESLGLEIIDEAEFLKRLEGGL